MSTRRALVSGKLLEVSEAVTVARRGRSPGRSAAGLAGEAWARGLVRRGPTLVAISTEPPPW
ncbi:MAG TPA: hypothetical protein VID93_02595 [Acidimicrobiales bacterium]